jgi:hypothetical protein
LPTVEIAIRKSPESEKVTVLAAVTMCRDMLDRKSAARIMASFLWYSRERADSEWLVSMPGFALEYVM